MDNIIAAFTKFDTLKFQPDGSPEVFLRNWNSALVNYENNLTQSLDPIDACARFYRAASQDNPEGHCWWDVSGCKVNLFNWSAPEELQETFHV